MELKEYMTIKRRIGKMGVLGKCNIDCFECPLSRAPDGLYIKCTTLETMYPERAEEIAKKWDKKHPRKTYKQDFFEKFPKAPRDEDGFPMICRNYFYDTSYYCDDLCRECWNETIIDEVQ